MPENNSGHKVNLLILNYEFPPLGGGAGNAYYYLLREFAKYPELEIDLVTSSADRYKVERFADNITIHYLDISKGNQNLHYQTGKDLLTYTAKAYIYARKLKRKKDYNLCHAFFGIPCGFIALLLKTPYIVSLRGSDVPFYNNRFYWLDKLVLLRLSMLIWRKAKHVIANSEGLKELAQTSSPDQDIKVIYNGVDTNQFYPLENKVSGDKIKLISTGRLIERKGYRYLIEALKDNDQVELTLVGDGNLAAELKELAVKNNANAKFVGMVEHDELPKYLREADIFVLPSLSEGMSNSVLEAMACGLPIIATDTGGSEELVKENGFILKKGLAKALRSSIDYYLKNKPLIKTHGEKSRISSEKKGWDQVASQYGRFYSNFEN